MTVILRQVGGKPPLSGDLPAVGLRRRKKQPSTNKRIYQLTPKFSADEIARIRTLAGPWSPEAYVAIRALTDPLDEVKTERLVTKVKLARELMALRSALVDAFDECQREKRDLVGIATNLNQAMRVANAESTVGWIAELLPGIYLLRDELAIRAQRLDQIIDRCDETLA